jgi:hypothetical protein
MPFLRVACVAAFGAFGIPTAVQAHCSASNLSACPSPPFNAARANTLREYAAAAPAAPDDAGSLPTLGPRAGPSPTTVANNVALKALNGGSYATAYRAGFSTPGDGGAATYSWVSAACSLNSGAGDNGYQVQPKSGSGCWIASFAGTEPSPMVWGAAGTGGSATNDTAAVQAAINAAAVAGVPLRFDSTHLYNVAGGLTIASPVDIEGPFRHGVWTTVASGAARSCSWGLTNTGYGTTTMLTVSAVTATIRGLCIDMTAGNPHANPMAGAAIALAPPSRSTYQTGLHIEQNTILNPYDGITIDGAGHSAACCGAGATADGNFIGWNTIISPAGVGISNGKHTAGAATVGNTFWDNAIVCDNATSKANGIGVALYDGAIYYDGTQNGPEGCNVGTEVVPGTASGHRQIAELNGDGVFGDQSATHDLLIQPRAGGTIDFLTIGGKAPWASATRNVNAVLVDCTATGSSCQEFNFNGLVAHGGNGQAQPIVDIEAGTGGPYDLTIGGGSDFCSFGAPTTGAVALKLNIPDSGKSVSGRWNIVGNRFGAGCPGGAVPTGILLSIGPAAAPPYGAVTIIGNDMSAVRMPISYTPNTTDHVIIANNMGIDDQTGAIASAASITLSPNFNIFGISGTTAVTNISGGWSNRKVSLIPTSGTVAFNTGGNICNAVSAAVNVTVDATWNGGKSCWNLH